jgi:hypothetical protein
MYSLGLADKCAKELLGEVIARRARLCNRDGLLLHHLVQLRAIRLLHFIELVDAADAVIRQHQRTTLEHNLPGVRIARDRRGEGQSYPFPW